MLTKEEVLIKHLNMRCRDYQKELDCETHLAILDAIGEYAQQEVKNTIKEVVKAQLIDAGQEGYKRGYEDGSEGLEPMKYDYVKENIV